MKDKSEKKKKDEKDDTEKDPTTKEETVETKGENEEEEEKEPKEGQEPEAQLQPDIKEVKTVEPKVEKLPASDKGNEKDDTIPDTNSTTSDNNNPSDMSICEDPDSNDTAGIPTDTKSGIADSEIVTIQKRTISDALRR